MKRFDVAVVGGGIVGLAHAWMAARRGFSVILFDRSARAQGATVRNFGMIWPIGQPAGPPYETALRSRELWLELADAGVLSANKCGAVHLAHRADELDVLEEFAAGATHDCRVLSRDETITVAPIANPDGLRGGLWSPTELRVDPRTAAARIIDWLQQQFAVTCRFNTQIVRAQDGVLHAADGAQWRAERTIVCSGSDLQTLFPETLAQSGLRLCKLQMLRTEPQPVQQTAHIASGLTLRHYRSFEHCSALASLKERVAAESPGLDEFGIHVMASQSASGDFILGDSHEYGEAIEPFNKGEIDSLMLHELKKIVRLPNWSIAERWHGVYAKHPELPIFEAEPDRGIHVCVGPGGAGMTMSFGLADQFWNQRES